MPLKNYATLIKEIKKGSFAPLYLFFGEEKYLMEEITRDIYQRLVDPNLKDFNYRLVYADEEDAFTIVDEAKTLPFMSERKLIVVKNIDRLKKGDDEAFIDYCLNPCQKSCVIFMGADIDRRRKFFQVLSQNGVAIRFHPLSERDLCQWIKKRLLEHHLKISEEALSYLVNFIGNDLKTINNELEKIISFVGERKEVVLEDLEAVTGDIHHRSIFELSSSIGWKREGDALRLMGRILLQGESPLKILGLISYQFRSILLTKFLLKKGYSSQKISKELGIPPTFVKEYIEQAKVYDFAELRRCIKELLSIDLKLKSSRLSPKIILESLILKMCALPESRKG